MPKPPLSAGLLAISELSSTTFAERLSGSGWIVNLDKNAREPWQEFVDALGEPEEHKKQHKQLLKLTVEFLAAAPDEKSALPTGNGYSAEQKKIQRALFNGLTLAAELGPDVDLHMAIAGIHQRQKLSGNYDENKLTLTLAEAMIGNQFDSRWKKTWQNILKGEAPPLFKGLHPMVGFNGIVRMPSQGCNHLPNDQALGEAISFVSVALIEKEKTMVKPSKNFLQNRLNRLLTNVAAAWPQTPWKQEFPDWARRFDWSNEMVQVAERFGQSAPKTVRVASVAAQGTDKITTPGMKALGKPPETHVLIM